MELKSEGKQGSVNFNVFNVVFEEVGGKLRVVGAFGANDLTASEDKWTRLNSRNFARALSKRTLLTR